MTNRATTTTAKARTYEEQRDKRRADTIATFTDLINRNKDTDPFFYDLWTDILYETAGRAVNIALRARHEKSGLQFLADLQNTASADNTARTAPQIAERITDLEELHESHRKGADFFTARANRLTLSNYERALAFTLAEDLKTKADTERAQIDDLYDTIGATLSDRADLVQTAIEQILANEKNPAPISKTVLASYGAEDESELTEDELKQAQASANFRAVINAVGRGIGQLATPDALNRTTTKAEKITPEEVADFILKYGGIGKDYKAPHTTKRARASDCYITIEERHTKTQDGFYRVYHYKTTAPYQYIDTYTEDEDGETDIAYLKTYNPFVSNETDIEQIEELAERANLTERERTFLTAFANRCRYDGDFHAVRAYAFRQIGITTATNQSTFFNRLKTKLRRA